ncbi:MucBP domain-containing protein, partial [Streptococcus pluranimalium]|uniref:MucBP domain-containing protein n=1 Tax=Streptococcus pluranimalium TaxID=82348 RepID=UPI0039FCF517
GGKLYRLDTTQLPDNAEGKVTEAPITVTYRYKLVTGTVTTKYVNEAGDEIKVADTQADLAVNSNYKTTKENELKHDGKLYRLDETKLPDNAEGKVTEAPITVTYRYKLVTGTVTTKYMNESGEEIKPADTQANLVVNSNYKTTKENELEHDGKLYRLDETKLPDNAEGKVTEAPITVTYRYKLVTGTVTTKYVNEAGDEIKVADTQANLTVNSDYTTSRDDEINHDGKVYRLDKTQEPDNAKGKVVQGSITVIYTYRLATSVVITEYVDDQGTPLQPATTQSGLPINANYVTTAKDQLITSNGLVYRLNPDKAPVNAKGSVTAKPIIVRYYYLPVRGTVTVTFIDQDTGQEIAAPTTPYNSVIAGTAYDVTSEAPKTLTQNGIDYDLVGIQTGNPVGQVPEGNHNVIYTYKRVIKKGSVVVHFIDEATGQRLQGSLNPITAAEEGTDYDVSHLPPSVINRGGESYELVGLQAGSSATGKVVAQTTEVTYLYRQVPKRGSVVLQYVNEASGLPLQDPVTVLENLVVQTPFDVTGRAPEMLTVNGVSYRLVGLDSGSSAKGTITVGITTVTYVYKELPKLGSVKLHFVDKTTKQAIQNPITVVTDQPVGTDYDVTSQAPKELVIDGNQYKRVGLHSGVATGNIIEGETHVVFLYEAIKKTTTTESVPPREPQNPTDKEKSPKTHSIEKGNSSTTKDKEKKEDKIEESHSKSSSKPSESQKANLPKTGEMSHPFEIVGYSMLISLWLLKKDGLKKKKSN